MSHVISKTMAEVGSTKWKLTKLNYYYKRKYIVKHEKRIYKKILHLMWQQDKSCTMGLSRSVTTYAGSSICEKLWIYNSNKVFVSQFVEIYFKKSSKVDSDPEMEKHLWQDFT